jgi:hypothetical protein
MRMVIVAALAITTSVAVADDTEDAHRQAISGRDSYWNCLAREYARDSNKAMSEPDFTQHIASVCPSERQNFRVTLVDYLAMQFPSVDSGAHMTTANNAIALAQKDIVTTFVEAKTRRSSYSRCLDWPRCSGSATTEAWFRKPEPLLHTQPAPKHVGCFGKRRQI